MTRLKYFAAVAALLAAGTTAAADDVLVWATGNAGGGDTAGVAAWLMASGQFTSVDSSDNTNEPLANLLNYDRILFFTNDSGSSDPSNGDVLADFADTGRRLVVATFSWANQGGNTLGGRIVTDGILPLALEGTSLYTNATIDTTDASAFWTGVNAITGFYRDDVALTPGSTLHGSWSDGEPILASRGEVVAVNLFPDDSFGQVSGDNRQLFVNALAVPTPGAAALLALGGLVAARRRRA